MPDCEPYEAGANVLTATMLECMGEVLALLRKGRFGVAAIAELFASLMTDVLGYRRFATQGGDWGAAITSRLAYQFPERLIGIHLNFLAVRRDPKMLENGTAEEKAFLGQLEHFLGEESGYQWIQGTKPTTLAFGLTDSP